MATMLAGCELTGHASVPVPHVIAPPAVTVPAPVAMARSANWSGYTAPGEGVTGIRAEWTEPQVSGQVNAHIAIWIGVGGWGSTANNLIQIGTLGHVIIGRLAQHQTWYETVPPNYWHLIMMQLAPGDRVAASMTLVPGSTRKWQLALADLTTGQMFTTTLTFRSIQAYADFVVEDPAAGTLRNTPYYPLAQFTPVTFRDAAVRYGSRWVSLSAVPSLCVTLVRRNGALAQPGALGDSAFTVWYAGQ